MTDTLLLQREYTVPTYTDRKLALVVGDGVHLQDEPGYRYLDFMSNYGIAIFGYRHPDVTRRLAEQLERLPNLHGSFANDVRAEAARRLVARCGGGLARVCFTNSGAEANEAALKFAVLATGKKRQTLEPLIWDFRFIPYGAPEALERAIDNDTAAFIVEPIQGEGGVRIPAEGYLGRAARICRSRGALMIVDEIQTGTGRTGRFLASHAEGLTYDIVTLGKGLAGGIPVGATLVSAAVAQAIAKGAHTSTFGGNPLAAAGILAVLELMDQERLDHIAAIGKRFLEGLRRFSSPHIVEARGRGLMIGLELRRSRDEVLERLQRGGVLAAPAGKNVVRFLPPYIVEMTHVDIVLGKLERILASLAMQGDRQCAAF
jgi:acetylornithine/LysW-gamma-L-lysine aminotransferase